MDLDKFRSLLEEQHIFPGEYSFKFVVPAHKVSELQETLEITEFHTKESKTGKFHSITFSMIMHSSDHVVQTYQKASSIEGLIAL